MIKQRHVKWQPQIIVDSAVATRKRELLHQPEKVLLITHRMTQNEGKSLPLWKSETNSRGFKIGYENQVQYHTGIQGLCITPTQKRNRGFKQNKKEAGYDCLYQRYYRKPIKEIHTERITDTKRRKTYVVLFEHIDKTFSGDRAPLKIWVWDQCQTRRHSVTPNFYIMPTDVFMGLDWARARIK